MLDASQNNSKYDAPSPSRCILLRARYAIAFPTLCLGAASTKPHLRADAVKN